MPLRNWQGRGSVYSHDTEQSFSERETSGGDQRLQMWEMQVDKVSEQDSTPPHLHNPDCAFQPVFVSELKEPQGVGNTKHFAWIYGISTQGYRVSYWQTGGVRTLCVLLLLWSKEMGWDEWLQCYGVRAGSWGWGVLKADEGLNDSIHIVLCQEVKA